MKFDESFHRTFYDCSQFYLQGKGCFFQNFFVIVCDSPDEIYKALRYFRWGTAIPMPKNDWGKASCIRYPKFLLEWDWSGWKIFLLVRESVGFSNNRRPIIFPKLRRCLRRPRYIPMGICCLRSLCHRNNKSSIRSPWYRRYPLYVRKGCGQLLTSRSRLR